MLAICYGAQLIANERGGDVQQSLHREYGKATLRILKEDYFFDKIEEGSQIWMSHGDSIKALPEGYELLASTDSIPVAVFKSEKYDQPVYGLQFHPEVTHTLEGKHFMQNFLFQVAKLEPNWTPESFIEETVAQLKDEIGHDQVIMAISGGVDSTVAAHLLKTLLVIN